MGNKYKYEVNLVIKLFSANMYGLTAKLNIELIKFLGNVMV